MWEDIGSAIPGGWILVRRSRGRSGACARRRPGCGRRTSRTPPWRAASCIPWRSSTGSPGGSHGGCRFRSTPAKAASSPAHDAVQQPGPSARTSASSGSSTWIFASFEISGNAPLHAQQAPQYAARDIGTPADQQQPASGKQREPMHLVRPTRARKVGRRYHPCQTAVAPRPMPNCRACRAVTADNATLASSAARWLRRGRLLILPCPCDRICAPGTVQS